MPITKEQLLDALQKINAEHGRGEVIHIIPSARQAVVRLPKRSRVPGTESFRLETLKYRLVGRTVFFRGHQATIPAQNKSKI